MNYRILFRVLLIALFCCINGNAQLQDCTLGLGGKDTEVLSQVFQLNDEQLNTMTLLIEELQERNTGIEDQIKELFDNHPQSTQEELSTLADKYKVLKDELVSTSTRYDQKLLGLFNEKQYQRYIALCREALRRPLAPIYRHEIKAGPE